MVMTVMGAFAALFLKKAVNSNKNMKLLLYNINFYIGGSLYVISGLLNIYVLKFLEYSLVLPFTAITYIWTLVIAKIFLKEKINRNKKIGVSLIVLGATLIVL